MSPALCFWLLNSESRRRASGATGQKRTLVRRRVGSISQTAPLDLLHSVLGALKLDEEGALKDGPHVVVKPLLEQGSHELDRRLMKEALRLGDGRRCARFLSRRGR